MRIPYRWIVAIAFVSGLFMEILDMTVLNTALPILGEHFGVGTSQLQWLVTAYLISLAGFIPASGWVADRFGDKRTFVFALTVYTAASIWAGLSGSYEELLIARIVQGVGGGLLTPVGTAMLFRAFPPHERARASAILAIPTTIAPALGPVLGGWLADEISWRWIFLLKVPIGVPALIFAAVALRPGVRTTAGRFDVLGFLTGGAGLATLLVGLERGAREGWTDVMSLALVGVGVLLAIAFWVTERKVAEPLIDLKLFNDRMFRIGNILMLPVSGAAMGALFIVPLMLQTHMGLSATESGLVTMFQAIGMLVMLPFTNRLFQRFGPKRLLVVGFTFITASQIVLWLVTPGTSMWVVRAAMFLLGLGGATSMVPLQAATFSTISLADTARASAAFSTVRQVAASIGVALVATVLTLRTPAHADGFGAFNDAFLVSALIGLIGIGVTLLMRSDDGAASLARNAPQAEPEPVSS